MISSPWLAEMNIIAVVTLPELLDAVWCSAVAVVVVAVVVA